MSYLLNPTLAHDTLPIGHLNLCELRLMNNQELLWLILVPQRPNVTECFDLSVDDQNILWAEIKQVSTLLKQHFTCDKLNIAMLGNVVSQLHVHVIARRFDDVYFPKLPFGLAGTPYSFEVAEPLIQQIRAYL
jgi:diadenosine tetraphosphate (Ap4A) HIT family hydrolase